MDENEISVPKPVKVQAMVGIAPVIDDLYDSNAAFMTDADDFVVAEEDADEPGVLAESLTRSSLTVDTTKTNKSPKFLMGQVAYGGGEYYPTLQRTLYILGRLYGSVPPSVFEDVSAEAIDLCRQSLIQAAQVLATKQTQLDGQLFLIKNLLMLREQVMPFDASFILREESLDFASMVGTLTAALKSSWTVDKLSQVTSFGRQLFAASTPQVVQTYADSKLMVDRDLKRVCEDVILETVKEGAGPVSSFLLKVSAFQLRVAGRGSGSVEKLSDQNFATPGEFIFGFGACKLIQTTG
jgi:hypothetical protein